MDDDAERLERKVAAFEFGPAGAVGGADPCSSSGLGSVFAAGAGVLVGDRAVSRLGVLVRGPEPIRDRVLGDPELTTGSDSEALQVATHECSADGGRADTDVACHSLNGKRPWHGTFQLGGCSHFSHITHFTTNSQ